MKHIHRITWIALALLVALALLFARDLGHTILAQSNATSTPNVNWVDTRSGINVRSGPGYSYNIIGVMPLGTWIQPISRSKDGQWILIAYQSGQGWIQRDGVFWRLNTASLPILDGTDFTPIPPEALSSGAGGPTYTPNANWVSVGLDRAYVRSGPGQGWLPVGQALTGETVEPVARDESGEWILIYYDEGYGWISRQLVLWVTNVESLPVYDDSNLTPAFTAAPTIALVTNTPTTGPTVTEPPTQPPTELASPTIIVPATSTTVRPDTTTPLPAITNTTVPTDTSVPPTTPPTEPPTQIPPTNTSVPPTVAPTSTPAPTRTSIPATPVPTEPPTQISPTSTPRPATNTSVPASSTPRPANTAVPSTSTPRPANTAAPPTQAPATQAQATATSVLAPLLPPLGD
ncbi:SH3 domain-containing protein [Aggregatilinea lenta]|uniref:SH3 domain-containing protein n=1 Tax=Aggregatilinea lenta TaxID=913108 RepID=UPI000E5A5022|nr:SH3 domain-containing protein [Aggregatilinea lenta]